MCLDRFFIFFKSRIIPRSHFHIWLEDSHLTEHYGSINAANPKRTHTLLESGKARDKIVLEVIEA